MKVVLLAALLAVSGVTVVAVAPAASACPDPDHPCTPEPIDPVACSGTPKITANPVGWAKCQL